MQYVHSCSELHPGEYIMLSQVSLGAHRVNVFEHNTGGRMYAIHVARTIAISGLLIQYIQCKQK